MTVYDDGVLNKLWVALGAALAVLGTAVADETVTTTEWVAVALAFLGALGVYQVSNVPKDST